MNGVPVRDETVTIDGLRFHYRDWGEPTRPPLLLLHGGTMHARIWDTFAPAMADRFRVLALDLRGHGQTEWADDYTIERFIQDIEEFVDLLRLDRFSLVGYSIGGRQGVMYAVRHPERVDRFAMVEICLWPPLGPDALGLFAQLQALPDTYADLDAAVAAYRGLVPRAPEDVLRRWVADGLKPDPAGRLTLRIDPALRRQPRPPGLVSPSWDILGPLFPQVACPTLLVCGGTASRVPTPRRRPRCSSRPAWRTSPTPDTILRWRTPTAFWPRCAPSCWSAESPRSRPARQPRRRYFVRGALQVVRPAARSGEGPAMAQRRA